MNKTFKISIFIIIGWVFIFLTSYFILASDSTLKTIDNCYNVTVDVELSSGNYTDVSFRDCSKVGRYHFECKCRDYTQPFKLVMKTDNNYNERYYLVNYSYNTYTINSCNSLKIVKDRGSYSRIDGYDNECVENIIKIPVYIEKNHTVYVDNIVNNVTTITETIYINTTIEKNNTIYYENTTKIKELENQYNEIQFINITLWICTIILAILIILIKIFVI